MPRALEHQFRSLTDDRVTDAVDDLLPACDPLSTDPCAQLLLDEATNSHISPVCGFNLIQCRLQIVGLAPMLDTPDVVQLEHRHDDAGNRSASDGGPMDLLYHHRLTRANHRIQFNCHSTDRGELGKKLPLNGRRAASHPLRTVDPLSFVDEEAA